MILEPPFHAHVEICVFTLHHSPTTAGNKVGIRIPDMRWRECDKLSPVFPAHFVLRNGCASTPRRLYSPLPSAFGHKIIPCQHLPNCTALFKAAISDSFIFPHYALVATGRSAKNKNGHSNSDVREGYYYLPNEKL